MSDIYGKLTYDGHGINRDGERIFTAQRRSTYEGGGYVLDDGTREAYGQLFKAAPRLLAALKAIIGDRPEQWGYFAAANVLNDDIRGEAIAAINEATGENHGQ